MSKFKFLIALIYFMVLFENKFLSSLFVYFRTCTKME